MVRIERRANVLTVILDRPAVRNAIDPATARALQAAFSEFANDPGAAVAVLYGEGGCFSAGADLHAVARGERHSLDPDGPAPLGVSRLTLDKPVIAAIEGHAVAGGLELALWADLRVAADDAVLGVFCRRIGVPLIDGGTARLPRLIGLSRALDLILTGRPVTATEALGMGLVNRVVPRGEARAAAETLAAELARFPPACLRADLRAAREAFDRPLPEALLRELAGGRAVLEAEGLAGAARFAEGAGRHGAPLDQG